MKKPKITRNSPIVPLTDRMLDLSKPKQSSQVKDEKAVQKFPKFILENSPIDRFYKMYSVEPEHNM